MQGAETKSANYDRPAWHFKQQSESCTWIITTPGEGIVEASDAEFKNFVSAFDLVRSRWRTVAEIDHQQREFSIDASDCRQWVNDCYGYERRGISRVLQRAMLERLLLFAQNTRCFTAWLRARHHTLQLQEALSEIEHQRAPAAPQTVEHLMLSLDALRKKLIDAASSRSVTEVASMRLSICRLAYVTLGHLGGFPPTVIAESGNPEFESRQAEGPETAESLKELLWMLDRRSVVTYIDDREVLTDMALIARLRAAILHQYAKTAVCDVVATHTSTHVRQMQQALDEARESEADLHQMVLWIGFEGSSVTRLVSAAMALGSAPLLKQCKACHLFRRQAGRRASRHGTNPPPASSLSRSICTTPEVMNSDSFLLMHTPDTNRAHASSLSPIKIPKTLLFENRGFTSPTQSSSGSSTVVSARVSPISSSNSSSGDTDSTVTYRQNPIVLPVTPLLNSPTRRGKQLCTDREVTEDAGSGSEGSEQDAHARLNELLRHTSGKELGELLAQMGEAVLDATDLIHGNISAAPVSANPATLATVPAGTRAEQRDSGIPGEMTPTAAARGLIEERIAAREAAFPKSECAVCGVIETAEAGDIYSCRRPAPLAAGNSQRLAQPVARQFKSRQRLVSREKCLVSGTSDPRVDTVGALVVAAKPEGQVSQTTATEPAEATAAGKASQRRKSKCNKIDASAMSAAAISRSPRAGCESSEAPEGLEGTNSQPADAKQTEGSNGARSRMPWVSARVDQQVWRSRTQSPRRERTGKARPRAETLSPVRSRLQHTKNIGPADVSSACMSRMMAPQVAAPTAAEKERSRRAAKALKLGSQAEAEKQKQERLRIQREQRVAALKERSHRALQQQQARPRRAAPSALDSSSSESDAAEHAEHAKQLVVMQQKLMKQAAQRVAQTRRRLKEKEDQEQEKKQQVWRKRDARLRKFAEKQRLRSLLARCMSDDKQHAATRRDHSSATPDTTVGTTLTDNPTPAAADAAVSALNSLLLGQLCSDAGDEEDAVEDTDEAYTSRDDDPWDWHATPGNESLTEGSLAFRTQPPPAQERGDVLDEGETPIATPLKEKAVELAQNIASKRFRSPSAGLKGPLVLGAYLDTTHVAARTSVEPVAASPHVKWARDLERQEERESRSHPTAASADGASGSPAWISAQARHHSWLGPRIEERGLKVQTNVVKPDEEAVYLAQMMDMSVSTPSARSVSSPVSTISGAQGEEGPDPGDAVGSANPPLTVDGDGWICKSLAAGT